MAKFTSIEELPQWFNLKNYSSVSQFGAVEWFRQLTQRNFLINALKISKDETDILHKEYGAAFYREIENMRGIAVEDTDIPNFFGPHGYAQFLADEQRGVIPLTFRHLEEHANYTDRYGPKKWFAAMSKITSQTVHTSETVDPPLFLNNFLRTDETFAALRVDMRLPKAKLRAAFEDWLSKKNAPTEQSPEEILYYKPNFKDLTRYGLLPYLDLLIWQMETGASISNPVMALAVTRHRTAEHLETTTIIWAEKLMGGGLGALLEQAATEAAALKPKSGR